MQKAELTVGANVGGKEKAAVESHSQEKEQRTAGRKYSYLKTT